MLPDKRLDFNGFNLFIYLLCLISFIYLNKIFKKIIWDKMTMK
jgi:hypothetical protein